MDPDREYCKWNVQKISLIKKNVIIVDIMIVMLSIMSIDTLQEVAFHVTV